jgi:hypothetical protein
MRGRTSRLWAIGLLALLPLACRTPGNTFSGTVDAPAASTAEQTMVSKEQPETSDLALTTSTANVPVIDLLGADLFHAGI